MHDEINLLVLLKVVPIYTITRWRKMGNKTVRKFENELFYVLTLIDKGVSDFQQNKYACNTKPISILNIFCKKTLL